jgi:hypothetical protein
MSVASLTLGEFSVFRDAKFAFSPGLNVLIGANATGKSHVVKLLYSILKIKRWAAPPGGPSLKEPWLSRAFWWGWVNSFSGKAGRELSFRDSRLSLRVEAAGGWVIAVLVFEVVEPFFSRAAAPQHIPS